MTMNVNTEDMLRQINFISQQDHSDETSAVRSARNSIESAQQHLERVKTTKDAAGNMRYSWDDRRAAENDLKEKFLEYRTVSNTAAREQRLKKEADEKKARDEIRLAQENKLKADNEARLKESLKRSYPGTAEQFEADWPEIRRQNYIRETLDREAAARAGMSSYYSRF